ncbi:sperm-associated antigen 5 [Lacerta agilis]|uniref:sperm-associated antigen 5 n=1 Tax=Lacerta agilis TaxID=80427 RepID=UPI0014198182|nr:sperm-associated antigen 5 [Lacerta agilis]
MASHQSLPNVCSEDKTSVHKQEKGNGIISVSVVPEVTWTSPSRLLGAGPNACSEDKGSDLHPEKDNGLISVPQLNLLEAGPNGSLEGKATVQEQEKDNGLTSVSVMPEATWTSPSRLPEAGPNASSENKASDQEQEKDNGTVSVSVFPEMTWTSPSRLLEASPNASSEDKGSVLHPEKDNRLTSVSPLSLLEAGPNASSENKASDQEQEKDNGTVSVSVFPEVTWTSPSRLLEASPNASSEDKGSILHPEKDSGLPSVPPLSLLEVRPNVCSEDKTSVHEQEKGNGIISVSVVPEMTWTSPSRLLEAGPNACSEDKGSVLHPKKDNRLTSVSPLSLLEDGPNASSKNKASDQEQEKDNGTVSVSVFPEVTWTSPSRLLEASPNASSEDKGSILHPEKDNRLPSVPPLSLLEVRPNVCSEDKTSVHEQEKGNGIISVSVVPEMTWTSPSRLLEAGPNACSEDKGSVLHPEKDNSLTSVSPLSLLEDGPNASSKNKASDQEQEKDNGTVSVSVFPEVTWTSPSRLLEASPNASSEDKGSVLHPEKDNSLTSVSPLSLLEAGPNAFSENKASDQEQEKDNGTVSFFVSPAASQMFPPNIMETGLDTSPMNAASTLWQQKKAAVSLVSAATWMSPLSLLETGVNTSLEERALTKDSTAETDSLLWHFSQDQLGSLSRAELEERLASAQIIVEALSRKIRDCLNSQRLPACVGPADQRDAATQTPISEPSEEVQLYREMYGALWKRHDPLQKTLKNQRALVETLATATDEMRGCLSDSTFLRETAEASFQRLQEDRHSLSQQQKQLGNLISCLRERWSRIEGERKKALRAKEAADHVLESFRNHASHRIRQLEQGCESRQHLCTLLAEANTLQSDLSGGYAKHLAEEACLATALQSNWAEMRHDYQAMRTLAGRFRVTMGQMVQKVRAAQQEVAQHQEVCRKLENSTQELVEALGRGNELTAAKVHLQTELEAAREKASAAESQRDRLQEEKEILSCQLSEKQDMILKLQEEAARLSLEKARAEQERDEAQREARETADCQEFIDLENQIARRQLSETEEELKATLVTLWERSAQLEELKGAHSALQQEREAVGEELASAKAEMERTRSSMEACACSLQEMGDAQTQLLEIVSFLERVLQGEVVDTAPRRRPCTPRRLTPHRFGTSFVDSILQAVAERDVETPGIWSESTAFKKAGHEGPPKPADLQEHLSTQVQDLLAVSEQLRLLTSQHQRATQEEGETLQAEILRLQGRVESLERELEAEVDGRDTRIAKLSEALHNKMQNEKELQEVIWQQDRKLQQLADQSADIRILKLELEQLKSDLRSCEMERSALWEELREQKPSSADWVQEKICLQRQVARLRELLDGKDKENMDLMMRYQGRMRHLEEHLLHTQREAKALKRTEARIKEVASSFPAEASHISEVRLILDILG